MTTLQAKPVTGRKDYSCTWCGEAIPAGEKHQYRAYILDGDFTVSRMHVECNTACDQVAATEGEFYFSEGEFPRGGTEPR